MITNYESIWKRAAMFHDIQGASRHNVPRDEMVWGINFRMPELSAAVAWSQLQRLDDLLERMRVRKRMLQAGLADVTQRKGIRFREIVDPEGDTAATLIFFVESAATAHRVCDALRAENIGASLLFHPDRPDYHVYAHWTGIISQRTWTPAGGPWRWAQRRVEYHPEMCARSLDLLGRGIHLNVDPRLDNTDIEEIIEGISRVLETLA
jgi:dTDP-4-amino-4,6-dideoxygalactose transaminase